MNEAADHDETVRNYSFLLNTRGSASCLPVNSVCVCVCVQDREQIHTVDTEEIPDQTDELLSVCEKQE